MSHLPQPLPGQAPTPAVRVYGRGGREHPGHHRRGAASPGDPQAELMHWDPEVIFAGQRCLVYAQLRGQPQPPDIPMGGITLQYRIQDQTYKETLQFSLQPQDGDR
ncbi:unnamed protein product [Caretta caretta]